VSLETTAGRSLGIRPVSGLISTGRKSKPVLEELELTSDRRNFGYSPCKVRVSLEILRICTAGILGFVMVLLWVDPDGRGFSGWFRPMAGEGQLEGESWEAVRLGSWRLVSRINTASKSSLADV
jgi:hypothetical protein